MVSDNFRILIIHPGALGDVIVSFPALILLRQSFSIIALVCGNQIGKIAEEFRIVDKAYPIESAVFASLYSDIPDSKITNFLQPYQKVVLFSYGKLLSGRLQDEAGIIILPPRPKANKRIHVGCHLVTMIKKRNLIKGVSTECHYNYLKELAPRNGPLEYNPSKIIIHPGSGSWKKNWPLEKYLEVEVLLNKKGFKAEYVIGPAELDLIDDLNNIQDGQDRNIHQLYDLLHLLEIIKHSAGFIGNDSGISHMAAFTGTPTVAVFGPSDPVRWKPIGNHVQVFKSGNDCPPCFETSNAICEDRKCLSMIDPSLVVDGMMHMLRRQ